MPAKALKAQRAVNHNATGRMRFIVVGFYKQRDVRGMVIVDPAMPIIGFWNRPSGSLLPLMNF